MKYHKLILIITISISILSCKSKINQTINNIPEGKWITIDTLDFIYTVKGKYRKGVEVGTWKSFNNRKLVKKEKYKKNLCKTTFYFPNGKKQKQGYTKLVVEDSLSHWFYSGKWRFYNQEGQLDSIKNYTQESFDLKLSDIQN
ncbi:hypothetical protein [Flavobacterium daejeonense]|uniref:hypothetical protein n=1 Tax=Flavobacterium daejeonense TaxID=350893 RepID=UPI00068E3AA6|nr:hypothetical protein [Flavobacterium daejeonense]